MTNEEMMGQFIEELEAQVFRVYPIPGSKNDIACVRRIISEMGFNDPLALQASTLSEAFALENAAQNAVEKGGDK
jgi:hypothetical protein